MGLLSESVLGSSCIGFGTGKPDACLPFDADLAC